MSGCPFADLSYASLAGYSPVARWEPWSPGGLFDGRKTESRVVIQAFDDVRLPELMCWFPDRESCQVWGGPEFRFPFTEASFREDAKLGSLPSWALLRDDGTLAGFGQCYLRAGRCHLGRLAIAPAVRGHGFGSTLVRELCRWGRAVFGVESCSIFVMPSNVQARRLYQRLGFRQASYPEPSPELDGFVYMITSGGTGVITQQNQG
jgi:ribosomal protein S18 acetylase RimI-like enzyme